MIERLNIIKFEFTFVGAEDVDKHPNNRLIDKDLKKTPKEPRDETGIYTIIVQICI